MSTGGDISALGGVDDTTELVSARQLHGDDVGVLQLSAGCAAISVALDDASLGALANERADGRFQARAGTSKRAHRPATNHPCR